MFLALAVAANAGSSSKDGSKDASATTASAATNAPASATTAAAPAAQDEDFHLEGERRFRSNCGRCHAAPFKFPPRMMATIVRHMRVRAAITDQDMRLILRYMTE
jgi:cytochrome c5